MPIPGYAAVWSLIVNLIVSIVVSVLVRVFGLSVSKTARGPRTIWTSSKAECAGSRDAVATLATLTTLNARNGSLRAFHFGRP